MAENVIQLNELADDSESPPNEEDLFIYSYDMALSGVLLHCAELLQDYADNLRAVLASDSGENIRRPDENTDDPGSLDIGGDITRPDETTDDPGSLDIGGDIARPDDSGETTDDSGSVDIEGYMRRPEGSSECTSNLVCFDIEEFVPSPLPKSAVLSKMWVILGLLTVGVIVITSMAFFLTQENHFERNFRLPSAIFPECYFLEVTPYMVPPHLKFDGNVTIRFNCIKETDEVILHSKDLTIHEQDLNLQDDAGHEIKILCIEYERDIDLLIVKLENRLKYGNSYELSIKYTGNFSHQDSGFIISSFQDKDNIIHYTAVTHFQPISARKAFPCFDEPELKANFSMTIVRPKRMVSLSNMPKIKTEKRNGDWEADVFQTSVKMSTYSVAYFIGDYEEKGGNDKVTVWASRNDIGAMDFPLKIGTDLLPFYERLFGIPYPLPKLDMVYVNLTSSGRSATESWGLIIFWKNSLLCQEYETSRSQMHVARIVADELAHQWFGNLVTMKWWNDMWLSEGTAGYLSEVALSIRFPEFAENKSFVRRYEQLADVDCKVPVTSVAKVVERYEDFANYNPFDLIAYKKSIMIFRMLHHVLGNKTFWGSLKKYLKDNSYGNVDEDILWQYFTEAQSDVPVLNLTKVMRPWIHLEGQPIISVIRNYDNGTAVVKQRPCSTVQSEHENDTWKVPLFYSTLTKRNSTVTNWLENKTMTLTGLPVRDMWILINEEAFGYYTVQYDFQNLKLLAKQLQKNHTVFNAETRLSLLYGVEHSILAKNVEPTLILDFYLYMPYEEDPLILSYFNNKSLFYVYSDYMEHDNHALHWNQFVEYVLIPHYESCSWNCYRTEVERKLSDRIVHHLCYRMNYKRCVNEALKRYKNLKEHKGNETKMSDMFIDTILCIGIKYGTKHDWMEMYNGYKSDELEILSALACSRDKELIKWSLKNFLKDDVQEFLKFAKRIVSNQEMWLELYQFIDENFNHMIRNKEEFTVLENEVLSKIKNAAKLSKVIRILKNHLQDKDYETKELMSKTISAYKKKITDINRNLISITSWLRGKPWIISKC